MIIKLTNLQNGLSAEFISTWTLPFLPCNGVDKLTGSDNLSMKFEIDKLPRGFDSQVNPKTTIVNIFNTNKQVQSSNAYYDRELIVYFRNLNTITPSQSVAENLAQLFTSNDKNVYLQIMDDYGNEYITTCAIIETPKSTYHDSFKLQMLSNSFSKISKNKPFNYSDILDSNGNKVTDVGWKHEQGKSIAMGINSYFFNNYNNLLTITDNLRLSVSNNNSGTLHYIILRNEQNLTDKVIVDLSPCRIQGNDTLIIDFKEKLVKVNVYQDFSTQVVLNDLTKGAQYRIEFIYYDNVFPNTQYTTEIIEDCLTVPHVAMPFDEGGA